MRFPKMALDLSAPKVARNRRNCERQRKNRGRRYDKVACKWRKARR